MTRQPRGVHAATTPEGDAGPCFIGTAGWSIPRASAGSAPGEGTHLQRYARVLTCAEINSSFHRPHRTSLYGKWAASTPPGFRFSVKLPRAITHTLKLRDAEAPLDIFLAECAGLGAKLAALLVQLPPSFAFDEAVVRTFLSWVRQRHAGHVACEPRHASWTQPDADSLLRELRVARVAADPSRAPALGQPGGWNGLLYVRLHGSPRTYWSPYAVDRLAQYADLVSSSPAADRWCIFDNTASGAAFGDALALRSLLERAGAAR